MLELVKSIKSVELLISTSYYFLIALLLFSGVSKVLNPQPLLETIKAVINVSEELLLYLKVKYNILNLYNKWYCLINR
ncbi:MAG: hypothetical protein AB1432_08100 [Bacteroidota bacterium]